MLTVVHVPYTYLPDELGGTEIYVQSLARELKPFGWTSIIAAPGEIEMEFEDGDARVVRFPHGNVPGSSEGRPDEIAAAHFDKLLEVIKPQIVHLHARTSAVSALLLRASRRRGIRTVVTYHSPTMSCPRGTMLLEGSGPCDGLLEVTRCTRCVLLQHGVPRPGAALLSHLPDAIGRVVEGAELQGRAWLAARMRRVVARRQGGYRSFVGEADRIVAVCDWVLNAILLNGADPAKVVLSRQGLPHREVGARSSHRVGSGEPLRIGYFGRLDPTKGVEVVIDAVLAAAANIRLDIYGVRQPGGSDYAQELAARSGGDACVVFHDALSPDAVSSAMRELDIVAVPSIWMETGPLVVLEAFATGTPVIGSDRGGIAELVNDGVDGVLVPPGDVRAWTLAINILAGDHSILEGLRANIRQQRTMADVASEMDALYRDLLDSDALR